MKGKEEISAGGILPVVFRAEDFRCSDVVRWSWHEEMEAGFVVEGTLSYYYENEVVRLSAGDGFFINAETRHAAYNAGRDYCLLYMIKFHPRLVGGSRDSIFWERYLYPVLRNASFRGVILRRGKDGGVLSHILAACVTMRDHQPGYEFAVRSDLSQVLFAMYQRQSSVAAGLSGRDRRMEERIRIMLDYLSENYMSQISLEDIARSASLSVSECIRCFKATVHLTPVQYLRQYRLEKAAELLMHTDLSISEAASYCGFQEMSYFTRCFRAQYSVTPTLYRKIYRSEETDRQSDGRAG